MLETTEMDFRRRAARRSTLKGVTNERIKEIVQVTNTIVDEIKIRQLM